MFARLKINTAKKFVQVLILLPLVLIATLSISIGIAYKQKLQQENDIQTYEQNKHGITTGVNIDYDRLGYFGETIIKKYKLDLDTQMFWNGENQIKLLDFLYSLGFREFRINFKWQNLSTNGTDVNFQKIDLLLRYFESKKDIKLNLCLGPFKNFGYPEQFVQEGISQKFLSKNNLNYISTNNEIFSIAKQYFTSLLEGLKTNYPQILAQTISYQVDNEPFHPFGSIPVQMTNEAEYQLIQIAEKYFPQSRLTFNTPLSILPKRFDQILKPDTGDVQSFIQYLEKVHPQLLFKLTLGINYYSNLAQGLQRTPLNTLDSITATNMFAMITRNPTFSEFNQFISRTAKQYKKNNDSGFQIKISELQEESWNNDFTNEEPGKSVSFSKKNITRLLSYQKSIMDTPNLHIDIWGAEQMAVFLYLDSLQVHKSENFIQSAQKTREVVQYYLTEFKPE